MIGEFNGKIAGNGLQPNDAVEKKCVDALFRL